jgi:hypothetical protein
MVLLSLPVLLISTKEAGMIYAILAILFIQMCGILVIAYVTSSKYYAVKYVNPRQEDLILKDKVQRFVHEMTPGPTYLEKETHEYSEKDKYETFKNS